MALLSWQWGYGETRCMEILMAVGGLNQLIHGVKVICNLLNLCTIVL